MHFDKADFKTHIPVLKFVSKFWLKEVSKLRRIFEDIMICLTSLFAYDFVCV